MRQVDVYDVEKNCYEVFNLNLILLSGQGYPESHLHYLHRTGSIIEHSLRHNLTILVINIITEQKILIRKTFHTILIAQN